MPTLHWSYMAKNTGAFEAVFNNDLDNLKYPKIKEYDAVFLNSIVGLGIQRPGRDERINPLRPRGRWTGCDPRLDVCIDRRP